MQKHSHIKTPLMKNSSPSLGNTDQLTDDDVVVVVVLQLAIMMLMLMLMLMMVLMLIWISFAFDIFCSWL